MKDLLNYINNNVLVRVSHLNSIVIGIKIISGLIISKAIAVFIGVEGMALVGNIRNFASASHSLAILGFYKGVVKYISKFKNNAFRLSETISTAYYLGFFSSMILAMLFYYNAESINGLLFSELYDFAYVIRIFSLALPFFSLNMFCFSILNGFSKYKILLIINIIGQILSLLVTLVLIYQENLDGAMVAAVLAPSLIFLITLIGILNRKSYFSHIKISNLNLNMLKRFGPHAILALLSTAALPLVLILIRNYLIDNVGIMQAGYWEAVNRLSDYYLMFINSIMALYIIPRYIEIKDKSLFRKEVGKLYKAIMPIFGVGILLIFIFKTFIIRTIFTEEFLPATDLFLWQLLGDFVKVLSTIIAYQFIAKGMFTHFIIVQVFLILMLYISSVFLIDIFGLKGAVIGHFVSQLLQYGIILLIFSNSLFKIDPDPNAVKEDKNNF